MTALSPQRALRTLAIVFVLTAPKMGAQANVPPSNWPAVLAQPAWISAPARFALEIRDSLALTPAQVTALQREVRSEADSSVARAARIRARQAQSGRSADAWAARPSDIDVLANALESLGVAPETVIGMARDREAVGAILTDSQRTILNRLWADTMRRAAMGQSMRPPSRVR